MFEKEAEEYLGNFADCANCKERWSICADSLDEYCLVNGGCYAIPKEQDIYIAGAKLGYNKAKEEDKWHYVKEGCKYPENGESVLVTVLDDDNEKIVTMALFEVENNKRSWDIESRLCSIHSGSEEVCSKIIAWARVLPAGGEK